MIQRKSFQMYVLKNNFFSKQIILYAFLSFGFVIRGIWNLRHQEIDNESSLGGNIFLLLKPFNNIDIKDNGFFIILIFRIFMLLSPILIITIFEFLSSKDESIKDKIISTSIAKTKVSEGSPYSDFFYFLFSIIQSNFTLIVSLLSLGLITINSQISEALNSSLNNYIPGSTSEITSTCIFLLSILLLDFIIYLKHFLAHKIPFLWDLHEFHHSSTEMTILCKDRNSILQTSFTSLITVPLRIFPAILVSHYLSSGLIFPFVIFIIDNIADTAFSHLGHSSLKILYPKPIAYVFMSPSLHWFHHSSNNQHYDSNFGMKYVFWDKLFGTFIGEEKLGEISEFGVKNTDYNKYNPLYSWLVLPYIKVFKRLRIYQLLH